MNNGEHENPLTQLIYLAMDCMGVAATIIDTKGTLLYYNQQAAKILDRKSSHIGTDIHTHHKKAASNKKVDLMIKEFAAGRTQHFHYQANPYGNVIYVTVAPIIKNGTFLGCVQTVRPKTPKPGAAKR